MVRRLALGIEAAHEEALEAAGATVRVLGCGIDVVTPQATNHTELRFSALLTDGSPEVRFKRVVAG